MSEREKISNPCKIQETESSSSDDETPSCVFQESDSSSDDEIDPFLFRIHTKLSYSGLQYSNLVPSVFYDNLMIFLRLLLRAMVCYKTHYKITCLMLTDGIIDPNAVIQSTKVFHGKGRFSVEDFDGFLQEYDHLIPNRKIIMNLVEAVKWKVNRKKIENE